MKNRLILIARAYNDLDCRLSILFNHYKKYNDKSDIYIIPIPTNKGFANFINENVINEIENIGGKLVPFNGFCSNRLLLQSLIKSYWLIPRKIKNPIIRKFLVRIRNLYFKIIRTLFLSNKATMDRFLAFCGNSTVIIDEIVFTPDRSFVIEALLKKRNNYNIISFLTGQDTYLDLWHDKKESNDEFKIQSNNEIPFFVPSKNDYDKYSRKFNTTNIHVIGNTRFDSKWIERLSKSAKKSVNANSILKKTPKHKILFMLSKIEYGIHQNNLIELINACANIKDSIVILKPHTRGMTLNSFKNSINKNIVDGLKIDSSTLIEWSNTVLFTGSSIIFQAMMLSKKTVFLKYCQKYKTVFDNFNEICIANDHEDVINYILNYELTSFDKIAIANQVNKFAHNNIKDGEVCNELFQSFSTLFDFKAKSIN